MSNAIRFYETGGPDVLKWEAVDPPPPQAGEVRVHHRAVGLNFIDIYHRTGRYPIGDLPAVLGLEAAGVVDAVGDGVDSLAPGDRVAYAGVPPGAYTEARVIPAHRLVKLPEALSYETAAAAMLQGMTARYLLKGCYAVKPCDTILIHAASGGVGSIVCQWAKHLGATVIGTVGSPEKAAKAKQNGCDHPILYKEADFASEAASITSGRGVNVVYDSVGKDTFMKSLDCLRPMGTLVSFGQSSGSVPPLDIGLLAQKGSLFLTRPSLMTYTEKREDLEAHARDLFEVLQNGAVKIEISQTFPLKEAAEAHRALESRKTTGSCLLMP